MEIISFEDFYEVPNLNFDISRLRNDLDKILLLLSDMDSWNYLVSL